MGTKPDMLSKFLWIIGWAGILFGVLSFFAFNYALFRNFGQFSDISGAPLSSAQGFLQIMTTIQVSGSAAIQEMALGGICLYLSARLKTDLNK